MLNFFDGLIDAASKLKKAVPLMVKYRIAPNPMNYAVWYNYVAGCVPELNKALDKTIKEYGTCPSLIAEELFKTYLADNTKAEVFDKANDGLSDIAFDIQKDSKVLKEGVKVYEKVLSDALSSFDSTISSDGLHPAVLDLVDKTGKFLEQNVEFQMKLDEAQGKICQLQAEVKKAKTDSYIDPLTNLYNRRYFDQRLESMLKEDHKSPYCLIIVDIDNFKGINDRYGHPLGDRVIKRVADIVTHYASEECIPTRLGGEEFGLLMPKAGMIDALQVADKMKNSVAKTVIKGKRDPGIQFSLTASFGVAQLRSRDTGEDLMDRSDKALYKAKSNGKNRVEAL
jgi:diguanylate cyclase